MGKSKKNVAAAKKPPRDPEAAARLQRAMLHTFGVIVFAALLGGAVYLDRGYVEQKLTAATDAPHVVLKNKPAWMTDFLAEQIAKAAQPAGLHSAFDHQLLVDTVTLLKANPWIREVHQVRRAYGVKPGDTLEVDCEYRAPVALVHWKDYFWLVDGDGVKLPEAFSAADIPRIIAGADGHMNIRVVEGVAHAPPESGTKWPGEDLHAGLDLVKLLFGRPCAEEIEKVDVTNFARRRDPKASQLVLVTKYNTEVRWGIPVAVTDDNFFVEVSPAQKLAYMEAIVKEKGRVDGHFPWVDIRFDAVTHPSIGNAQTAGAELQR